MLLDVKDLKLSLDLYDFYNFVETLGDLQKECIPPFLFRSKSDILFPSGEFEIHEEKNR